MGQTSKKLHSKLTKMAAPLDLPTGKMKGRADMPDKEKWIKERMDPVHAAYAFVQNISSSFAEGVSRLPEMKRYAKIVGPAEEEYMPSGPPMSPLTADHMKIQRVKGRRREVRRLLAEQSRRLLEAYRKGEKVDALACPLQRALATR